MPSEACSITLAGGASSRMPADMRPKPCCKVGALSVIEHALRAYEQAGIYKHVVVVGQYAEKVMAELAHNGRQTLYAFQDVPRGTGDAVRRGLDLLAVAGAPEYVLISAGDKIVAPSVVRGLIDAFAESRADLCLAAGRAEGAPMSGRVIERDGRAIAIIESPDIRVRQLAAKLRGMNRNAAPKTVKDLADLASQFIASPAKLAACFPELGRILAAPPQSNVQWDEVQSAAATVPEAFEISGHRISPDEASATEWVNESIYFGRYDAIRAAVQRLRADNAQKEWYFTDVVQILNDMGKSVCVHRVADRNDVMDFNTVEELEVVRRIHAQRTTQQTRYPSAAQWISAFERQPQANTMLKAVRQLAAELGGETPCFLVRSPGRINLMGRHIDHQGGTCNLMAIDQEIVFAVAPRNDDKVNLWNASASDYPFRSFAIRELTADLDWEDWLKALDTQYVRRYVTRSAGDWVNYVKGATLRLQHRFRERSLRGMDVVVCGNIMAAAGLSSSSALVVATTEALVEINSLNVSVKEFIDLCGEGEWFVGTRGGSADHAAIKFSRANEVVAVSFFPFRVIAHYPFPADCRLLVCNSGISAKKTENARARFNARVACYHMAREMIKRQFPQFADKIEQLRDVNTERLGISLPALYALLRQLPNQFEPRKVEELAVAYPSIAKCVTGLNLAEHDFPLRDVALFGLAECERARRAGELLGRSDSASLGRLMSISHDGDRIAKWNDKEVPFENSASDELLDDLVRRSSALASLESSQAALWQQPGAYDCSLSQIDFMVDLALRQPGVLGAQIAGAGLGGCIMALVKKDAAEATQNAIITGYYEPHNIEPQTFICSASRGSQVVATLDYDNL